MKPTLKLLDCKELQKQHKNKKLINEEEKLREPTYKEVDDFLKEHNIHCWNYPYCYTENCIGCKEWDEEKEKELTIKRSIKFLDEQNYQVIKKQDYHKLLRDFEHAKRELAKLRVELNRRTK